LIKGHPILGENKSQQKLKNPANLSPGNRLFVPSFEKL
jgi:hypothetical protein